jgi:hypothetical protein
MVPCPQAARRIAAPRENGPVHWDEINLVTPGWNGGWAEVIGPPGQVPGEIEDLYVMPGAEFRAPLFSRSRRSASRRCPSAAARRSAGSTRTSPSSAASTSATSTTSAWTRRDLTAIGEGFGSIVDIDTGPDECLYLTIYGASGTGTIARICPRGAGEWWVLY